MFQNWLKANSEFKNNLLEPLISNHLGKQIDHFKQSIGLKNVQIALIGLEDEIDLVRKYLYQLSFPFSNLKIIDMGNLRKSETEFAIPIIREVLAGQIFPIVIGTKDHQAVASYHAFKKVRPLISLGSISERLYFSPGIKATEHFYNPIFLARGYESQLFHFTSIGGQSHFISPEQLAFVQKRNFDYLGLGNARLNLQEVEPFIRDADILNFHLNAIKQNEAPGVHNSSPSGFSHEEACQLMRYAGMSDKLKTLGIYGFHPEADLNDFTAKVVAQLIWYFFDGYFNRKKDFPVSEEDLVEYIIEAKNLDTQMIFYRSNKSGRWWMRVPIKVQENNYRHGLIPCSYSDYQLASQDEFPERLVKAIQRFT